MGCVLVCSVTDLDLNLARFFPTDVQPDGYPWMANDGLPFYQNQNQHCHLGSFCCQRLVS
jgi:hypothetical protein